MKKKYQLVNGKRVSTCSYKNCRQPAKPDTRACARHYQEVYRLTRVAMEPTRFSRFMDEAIQFIEWLL